jgi:N-acetylmuramoyl-L-alanine amidase
MKKVFIGVGHGGSDGGAVANGVKEKDLNLSIALACRDELERHGISVKMSRTKDENDTLSDEIKECNAFSPDLAVDIHNNAGGGDGAEAFYHYGGGKSKTLAENILAEIVKIGQNSRGAKIRKNSSGSDYYGFIRQTSCPAVIIECAFVDNASDLKILATESQRKAMGVAIAKGILKTLGVEYEVERGTLYRVQVGAYLVKANAEAMQKKIKAVGFDAFIVKE